MKKLNNMDRRSFIETAGKGAAVVSLTPLALSSCTETTKNQKPMFVHHVYFWLHEPENPEVRKAFQKGLEELVTIETIKSKHLGIPAKTDRDVIDSSYSYSLLLMFDNKEDQDIYQTHPTHLKFIEENQQYWKKVVVYDSVDY